MYATKESVDKSRNKFTNLEDKNTLIIEEKG